ncbi:choline ABC transporter ATP-binding protein [Pelagibius litoralis]|uniref:Trimethylamine N-oxide transport system ATP-binding protein TmoW n=1 Tax=Pelagibius litoralis TaxID=374515 RepID=A0A967C5I6_9PROT|nr:choline ABC transporter ATP-binding protein [Pelagibius litoralis]NIA68910.1 choline ABC transporter ATP-binding protein [Pelagibius litoralis]
MTVQDTTVVDFQNVDIIFGKETGPAVTLLDGGATRDEILDKTGNVLGVAGASLAIEEGEICVLMGLSGSGKSTLLRAVNGLNKVTRGVVMVRDESGPGGAEMVDVASCDAATLRRLRMNRVAMVFQQFALLPWRTVKENVGLGLELRGMATAERDAIVEEKLEMVGLSQWKDKFAHELSGGMQQRVGLARAFATDADILLMDEPFSALDPLIRDHLQDELLELQHRLKKTIIFVSHDLDEALKLGTHIAIMEAGRIVQYGEPEAIVLNPANDYVAEFVAHMNPLNVLRGGSLMTSVAELKREDDSVLLDSRGRFRVKLDDQGAPVSVTLDGYLGRLLPYSEDLDMADLPPTALITAPCDMSMRVAIELRQATGHPVALMEDGKLVGVCGDEEIYAGILRQSQVADKPAEAAAS